MSDLKLDPMRPWGIAECAEYLGVSKSHFMQAVRYADGFPDPLPQYAYTMGGTKRLGGGAEWAGIDVMTWRLGAERITRYYRETHATV